MVVGFAVVLICSSRSAFREILAFLFFHTRFRLKDLFFYTVDIPS